MDPFTSFSVLRECAVVLRDDSYENKDGAQIDPHSFNRLSSQGRCTTNLIPRGWAEESLGAEVYISGAEIQGDKTVMSILPRLGKGLVIDFRGMKGDSGCSKEEEASLQQELPYDDWDKIFFCDNGINSCTLRYLDRRLGKYKRHVVRDVASQSFRKLLNQIRKNRYKVILGICKQGLQRSGTGMSVFQAIITGKVDRDTEDMGTSENIGVSMVRHFRQIRKACDFTTTREEFTGRGEKGKHHRGHKFLNLVFADLRQVAVECNMVFQDDLPAVVSEDEFRLWAMETMHCEVLEDDIDALRTQLQAEDEEARKKAGGSRKQVRMAADTDFGYRGRDRTGPQKMRDDIVEQQREAESEQQGRAGSREHEASPESAGVIGLRTWTLAISEQAPSAGDCRVAAASGRNGGLRGPPGAGEPGGR